MMHIALKAFLAVCLLFSAVNAEFDFDLEAASTLNWEELDPQGRALQQAGVRPCRWNTNFGSCDFNYDYVAGIKPRTTAAVAARQSILNAKVCDSAAYQASQARCQGDAAHFCKWVGGTGNVKCTAYLQEFFNYYLACPGSVAKSHFLCSMKSTAATCRAAGRCRWLAPPGKAPSCTRTPTGNAVLESRVPTFLSTSNLAAFRQAWGVCPGSNTAFNQTFCSKQATRPRCTASRYCTFGVFGSGGVCYTNSVWSPVFLYQNDPSFKFLINRCNRKDKASCEGGAAVALAANSG